MSSILDYTKGFGGKFGVETDKVDKSAVGFEYQGKTEKHESQKGGCGGGVKAPRLLFSGFFSQQPLNSGKSM